MVKNINIINKKVNFEYFILEKFSAGIKLLGSEVKSIRLGKVSITETFCYFNDGELFVKGLHISEIGNCFSHKSDRDKKLLLKKRELINIQNQLTNHITIVPTRIYENDRGLLKMEVALVKGKKLHDKRNSLKEKQIEKEVKRKFGK